MRYLFNDGEIFQTKKEPHTQQPLDRPAQLTFDMCTPVLLLPLTLQIPVLSHFPSFPATPLDISTREPFSMAPRSYTTSEDEV